jgi:hypothetical protein
MPKPTKNEATAIEELMALWMSKPIADIEPDLVSDETLESAVREMLTQTVQRPDVRLLMAVTVSSGGGVEGAMNVLLSAIGTHPRLDLAMMAPVVIRQRKRIAELEEQVVELQVKYEPVDIDL